MQEDLQRLVLRHLHADALASVRLVLASRPLWAEKKTDADFWQRAESILPHHTHYAAFRSVFKHMGVRRRVLAWASYCDSRCTVCKVNLFGICSGTFAVNVKLCCACKCHFLLSELELARFMPINELIAMRGKLRYCWIPYRSGQRVRHYRKNEALEYYHNFNSSSRVGWVVCRP